MFVIYYIVQETCNSFIEKQYFLNYRSGMESYRIYKSKLISLTDYIKS